MSRPLLQSHVKKKKKNMNVVGHVYHKLVKHTKQKLVEALTNVNIHKNIIVTYLLLWGVRGWGVWVD